MHNPRTLRYVFSEQSQKNERRRDGSAGRRGVSGVSVGAWRLMSRPASWDSTHWFRRVPRCSRDNSSTVVGDFEMKDTTAGVFKRRLRYRAFEVPNTSFCFGLHFIVDRLSRPIFSKLVFVLFLGCQTVQLLGWTTRYAQCMQMEMMMQAYLE